MRIAFFGLPIAALLLLKDGLDVRFAVLSPIPHPGRRRLGNLLASDRILDALEDDSELVSRVDELWDSEEIDLLVSWFWTRRIPEAWLSRAHQGGLGVHPSLLPRHRGPNPFFAAIDQGDPVTGVTVHRLAPTYDTGAILAQEVLPMTGQDSWQLAKALDRPSLRLLRQTVGGLARGQACSERPQDETLATWAPEPSGDLAKVDWRWPTERVIRRIRALSPVPGLAVEVRKLRLFITGAVETNRFPAVLEPGEAGVVTEPTSRLVIRTGDSAIEVASAQLASEEGGVPIAPEALAALVSLRSQMIESHSQPEGDE